MSHKSSTTPLLDPTAASQHSFGFVQHYQATGHGEHVPAAGEPDAEDVETSSSDEEDGISTPRRYRSDHLSAAQRSEQRSSPALLAPDATPDHITEKLTHHFGQAPIRFLAPQEHGDDDGIFKKPRLRQFLHGNQLVREKIERKPSWNEAFYDLIFVAIIAHFSHDQLKASIPPAFPVLFIAVFRAWLDTTHFLNKFDADDKIFKIFVLFEMMGVVGMGMNSDVMKFNTTRGFAISYLWAKFFLFLMNLWVVIWVPKARPNCTYQMVMIATCSIPWFVSLAFPENIKLVLLLWAGGLLCEFIMILAVAYINLFFIPLNIEHITERLANFIIIVFGEDIAALIFVETGNYNYQTYLLAICGMLIVFGFQLIYFDIEETPRHRLLHAMRRRKYLGQSWSILHIFYSMSLMIFAAGVALAIDLSQPPEHREHDGPDEENWLRTRLYFAGGFVATMITSTLIGSLHKWHFALERIPKWFRFMIRVVVCLYVLALAIVLNDIVSLVCWTTVLMLLVIILELIGSRKKAREDFVGDDIADIDAALESHRTVAEGNFLA